MPQLRDNEPILGLNRFPVGDMFFVTRISARWRWISRNWERFLFITSLYTKTVLIFYTFVTVWELQVAFWSLFFLLKNERPVKTCHVLFVTISILGKGLEFEIVSWKWTLVLYISLYKSRERGGVSSRKAKGLCANFSKCSYELI